MPEKRCSISKPGLRWRYQLRHGCACEEIGKSDRRTQTNFATPVPDWRYANCIREQVYLNAWLRAEQNNALHLLEKRVAARRYIPSIQCGLALTYNKLG